MIETLSNMTAEQIILGTLLYDGESLDAAEMLVPSDFAIPEHCEIFALMQRSIRDGNRPTAHTLAPIVASMRISASMNGAGYLAKLASVVDRTSLRTCIASVKDMAARRALLMIGGTLQDLARDGSHAPQDVALDAITHLDGCVATVRSAPSRAAMVGEAARDLLDDLDTEDDGSLIPTGLKTLDNVIGGLSRGEMTIVAGRPSMGKSALLVAMARRSAKLGVNTLIFSLEMQKRAVVARMMSDFVFSQRVEDRVPYADILRKQVSPAQRQKLAWALEGLRDYPIKIDDQAGLTMAEIQIRARKHADMLDKQGKRLDVVMIDHIGKIRATDRYSGNMVHETGEKSNAIMMLGKDLDVASVAAHQLNRGPEGREDKHPTPADLRDTGNLEQDAHTILFPYRQAYYLERQKFEDPDKDRARVFALEKCLNKAELIIAKSRNGACKTIECFCDIANNVFQDLGYSR